MYLHYTPKVVQWLYPHYTWHKSRQEKIIYLSFDDGPVPDITPFVLDQLGKYKAKATFFCVGENVQRYPDVLHRLLEEGHSIGNHSNRHLDGSKCSVREYCRDVERCRENLLQEGVATRLFRPPYGRIRKAQGRELLQDYEILMWDVLSADFDRRLSPQKCLQQSLRHTQNGSVVVFHDSKKAWQNMAWALPRYLAYFADRGYTFKGL